MEGEQGLTIFFSILALALCAFGYGFFILVSVSILRARKSRMEELSEARFLGAAFAQSIIDRASRFLLVTQIWQFASGIGIGLAALACVRALFRTEFFRGFHLIDSSLEPYLLTFLLLLVGAFICLAWVQVAKALAYSFPEQILALCSPILYLFQWVAKPFVFGLERLVRGLLSLGGISKPEERELAVSAEELSEILAQSGEAGLIDKDEQQLIQGVFGLSQKDVSEIMTPRTDITYVTTEDEISKVLSIFQEAGYSRVLVVGDGLDDVRGMYLAKDFIPYVGKTDIHLELPTLLRPIAVVDGNRPVDEVLARLRAENTHLAVVLDEHGGVDGLVTLEDLIEEIVGDIFDETDSSEDREEVIENARGELLIDGGLSLDSLSQEFGVELPAGEYDTVAGFVIHELGRIPEAGERVRYNGSVVSVEEVEENRVVRLKILPLSPSEVEHLEKKSA